MRIEAKKQEKEALEKHLDILPDKPWNRDNNPWVGSEGYRRGLRSRRPRSPRRTQHRPPPSSRYPSGGVVATE